MDNTGQSCAECLAPVSTAVHAQNGASLCPQCAEQFYRPCGGCGGLIPQDEAVLRDGVLCCVSCLVAPVSDDTAVALSDAEASALVAEFVRLHAEAKQLNDRLDAVKEQLKRHAASQPRVANAVLLRAGEDAVKCGYSVRVSYHAEQLAAIEAMLGTEQFTALFARKLTFSAVKEPLETFLASEAADTAAARAAILAAAERTEIATVTPVTARRKTGTSNTPPVPAAARPQL
jgi:hypothetical protein